VARGHVGTATGVADGMRFLAASAAHDDSSLICSTKGRASCALLRQEDEPDAKDARIATSSNISASCNLFFSQTKINARRFFFFSGIGDPEFHRIIIYF
jgi:hypothetical protein